MKIALVSPYDFAFPGGVCHHIICLEHYLTKAGHQVKVIAPASKAIPSLGNRFIPVGKPRPVPASGSICRLTISPLIGPHVREILDREQFDIIHLHEPLMPMLCTTMLRLSQTTTIGTFHASGGNLGYNLGKPISTFWLRRWFSKLDGRIAVSNIARDFANHFFPDHYEVIPNGVDLDSFSADAKPLERYKDGKLNIVFVGRLEKRKGANYLLEAFCLLKQNIPESRLILVGPGTRLRRIYARRVKRWHLPDVEFVGQVSYEDLPRYYQTADIVCSPATNCESFGIILVEAMAMGKPLVASDIDGYTSVVTDGKEGLLIPPRDAKKLAAALERLLKDPALRREMGSRGKLRAQEYRWDNIGQRILNYYMKVLSEVPHEDKPARLAAATP